MVIYINHSLTEEFEVETAHQNAHSHQHAQRLAQLKVESIGI